MPDRFLGLSWANVERVSFVAAVRYFLHQRVGVVIPTIIVGQYYRIKYVSTISHGTVPGTRTL